LEKKKKTGGKVTEGIVAEHCKSLVPLLKFIPGCESMNDDIQECTNQDEEQITDDNMADRATDAGDIHIKNKEMRICSS
jgi:NADH:ubiquinone oxidoreductase subunit B-like Fe-S oxidoreductase